MASEMAIIERAVRLAAGLAFLVAPAAAHETPRTAIRELVRLQGYVVPPGEAVDGETLTVAVGGRDLRMRLVDRQVFIAVGAAGRGTTSEPARLVIRGERALLARLGDAGPRQRVTLLGERRPGGSDLFVAAVDLCPPTRR